MQSIDADPVFILKKTQTPIQVIIFKWLREFHLEKAQARRKLRREHYQAKFLQDVRDHAAKNEKLTPKEWGDFLANLKIELDGTEVFLSRRAIAEQEEFYKNSGYKKLIAAVFTGKWGSEIPSYLASNLEKYLNLMAIHNFKPSAIEFIEKTVRTRPLC